MEQLQALANPTAQPIDSIFGVLGTLLTFLTFTAAVVAAFSYWKAARLEDVSPGEAVPWRRLARMSFWTQTGGIIGIVITLFVMILGNHFEYHYVWSHSSTDLPLKYVLSCFWEGQEGSFLLWGFWHAVLGSILMYRAGRWEASTMTVIALVQVFVLSFLLGIYVGDIRIGNSPFMLLSDVLVKDPVFLFEDYMRFVQDGTGLNALLQNYWMTIHPPVLFLGYGGMLIPFAFGIAGLWKKDYTGWIQPVLPWTTFAVGILGIGILMGGAWAYESLSFGGFWAWDPVENASLVPWMMGVAALHMLVVSRATKQGMRTAFFLILSSWIFVLYASFLTRSGILGETSVHSFVDAGLQRHLLFFLVVMVGGTLTLLVSNWINIPTPKREEAGSSREFWMFLGALVLFFASIQIILVTSIPAINALIGSINSGLGLNLKADWPTPAEPEAHYNSVHIWVAIGIALFMGFSQFFRYKETKWAEWRQRTLITAAAALIPTGFTAWAAGLESVVMRGDSFAGINPEVILLFAAWFAVCGNIGYWINAMSGKVQLSGAWIAHAGFGVMLAGILVSNARQEVISRNVMGIDYGKDFEADFKRDNILLYKNLPQTMGDYKVTYLGDSLVGTTTFYKVHYEPINGGKSFELTPFLLVDKKTRQQTPNPATRHYLHKDVFTHVSVIPNRQAAMQGPQTEEHEVQLGDTIFLSRGFLVLEEPVALPPLGDTLRAGIQMRLTTAEAVKEVIPELQIVQGGVMTPPLEIPEAASVVMFRNVDPQTGIFKIMTLEENSPDDWIIMKAIIFPQINLVWFGALVMGLGFALSTNRRRKERKRARAQEEAVTA